MSPKIVARIKKNCVHSDMYLPDVMVSYWGRSGSNLTNDNASLPKGTLPLRHDHFLRLTLPDVE
jgi:hypothetical protein